MAGLRLLRRGCLAIGPAAAAIHYAVSRAGRLRVGQVSTEGEEGNQPQSKANYPA